MRRAILAIMMIPAALMAITAAASAAPAGEVRKGRDLYEKGEFAAAARRFEEALQKDPESDIIHFNLGTARFKAGDDEQAIDHLQRALLSEDPELRARAHYNLGNAFYRTGIGREDADLPGAIKRLKESLGHFEQTMAARPEDEDARHNHDVVKGEIERLKKKLEQQQNQQQQRKPQSSQKQDRPEQQSKSGQKSDQRQGAQDQDQSRQPEDRRQGEASQSGAQQDQVPQAEHGEQEDNEPPPEQSAERNSPGSGQAGQDQPARQGERPASPESLTPEEARMMLNEYEQNDQPDRLLNFVPRGSQRETPVQQDW